MPTGSPLTANPAQKAFGFNDIEGEHYAACPLGHDKLETTARYARVATGMISGVVSPLDEAEEASQVAGPEPR